MDVYGSASLTAWTVVNKSKGEERRKSKTLYSKALGCLPDSETHFVRSLTRLMVSFGQCQRAVKTALKEQNTIIKNQMVRKRYRLRGKKKIYNKKSNLTIRIILVE